MNNNESYYSKLTVRVSNYIRDMMQEAQVESNCLSMSDYILSLITNDLEAKGLLK